MIQKSACLSYNLVGWFIGSVTVIMSSRLQLATAAMNYAGAETNYYANLDMMQPAAAVRIPY
jgi:hypothetical protein